MLLKITTAFKSCIKYIPNVLASELILRRFLRLVQDIRISTH